MTLGTCSEFRHMYNGVKLWIQMAISESGSDISRVHPLQKHYEVVKSPVAMHMGTVTDISGTAAGYYCVTEKERRQFEKNLVKEGCSCYDISQSTFCTFFSSKLQGILCVCTSPQQMSNVLAKKQIDLISPAMDYLWGTHRYDCDITLMLSQVED